MSIHQNKPPTPAVTPSSEEQSNNAIENPIHEDSQTDSLVDPRAEFDIALLAADINAIAQQRNTHLLPKSGEEKRLYPRYYLRWPVVLASKSHETLVTGTTFDISKGGIAVLSETNLLVKTRIPAFALLTIPPSRVGEPKQLIEVPGFLVHAYLDSTYHQFRIGMEFGEMDNHTKVTLHEALSKHNPAMG